MRLLHASNDDRDNKQKESHILITRAVLTEFGPLDKELVSHYAFKVMISGMLMSLVEKGEVRVYKFGSYSQWKFELIE